MKVTICELSNKPKRFKKQWDKLVKNVNKKKSELVLLNEMPFSQWIAIDKEVDEDLLAESVGKHEEWINRIPEFEKATVIYSKPVIKGGKCYNTAYYWNKESGHVKMRSKYYFPNEEYFYEENWFDKKAGDGNFSVTDIRGVKVGVLLCSELWFMQHARAMGKMGMDILVCPRATGAQSLNQWIRAAQTAAIISGAFCISSNRGGTSNDDFKWGGTGWVCQPGDGKLITRTTSQEPILTINIDISKAKKAKSDYPLYIVES